MPLSHLYFLSFVVISPKFAFSVLLSFPLCTLHFEQRFFQIWFLSLPSSTLDILVFQWYLLKVGFLFLKCLFFVHLKQLFESSTSTVFFFLWGLLSVWKLQFVISVMFWPIASFLLSSLELSHGKSLVSTTGTQNFFFLAFSACLYQCYLSSVFLYSFPICCFPLFFHVWNVWSLQFILWVILFAIQLFLY